ncbi:hypothetical protein N0V88_000616 [Collariella sp. IMI 366227]|nr:hypothetical protein N0V88_000616 [Collariella sp. IMI 366227]
MFNRLLGDIHGHTIPDVTFLVNHLDEPRVLFPPISIKGQFTVTDLSRRPTWEAITGPCSFSEHQKGTTRKYDSPMETYGLPLVTNRSSALELCQHPEYATMHGLFQSPASFLLIKGLVPVLSTGIASTMSDILIPSSAYFESEFLYNSTDDILWDSKSNTLYWAGSNTGGLPTSAPVPGNPSAALHSKLAFDLDGNGISGRFLKLLASNSLVLKQTVLREWHDERLVPWLHYVPVSMEMGSCRKW